ncbi:MAG: hypothetical protein STSR0006_04910 [Lentimicrobium sp.]
MLRGGVSDGFNHLISTSKLLYYLYRLTYRCVLLFPYKHIKNFGTPIITEFILNINMLHRHSERGWNTGVKENTNHPDYDAAIATTRQLI